jgi:hypothetical protein
MVAVGVTVWDDDLAAEIIEVAAISPRSMGWLVAHNPHWPCLATIYNWKTVNAEFRNALNSARRLLADELAFQILDIGDDGSADVQVIERKDGSTFTLLVQEVVNRSKLKCENRKWLAGKLAPEVYGERIEASLRVGQMLTQEEALEQLR